MDIINAARDMDIRNRIFKVVSSRKNLLFYDGVKDDLEKNIDFKFFYSSPDSPLEFISIDIFRVPENFTLKDSDGKIWGMISIIKEYKTEEKNLIKSHYGLLSKDNIEIREIKKSKITLYLNETGIIEIENAIGYFESLLF